MSYTDNPMHKWFKYLFDQRMNKNGYVFCFECGKAMHEDDYKDISACYSHILGKKQYPTFAGMEENIKIVHPDCHNIYTMTPKKAVHQYAEYLKFKQKYNL